MSVSTGSNFTCALRNDGTVSCWGRNNFYQLGDGTTTDRTTPVQVMGLSGVLSISAGQAHTCAALNDGTLWCWGHNPQGQLGLGHATDQSTPVQVLVL